MKKKCVTILVFHKQFFNLKYQIEIFGSKEIFFFAAMMKKAKTKKKAEPNLFFFVFFRDVVYCSAHSIQ